MTATWTFYDVPHGLPRDFAQRARAITFAGFGFNPERGPMVDAWIQSSLARTQLVGLYDGDQGVMFVNVPQRRLLGKRFYWGDGASLVPSQQGKGLAMQGFFQALDHLGRKEFGWVGGRTQNPYAWRLLSRLGFLRPMAAPYNGDEGQAIAHFLAREIPQLQGLHDFDPETGICRDAFPGDLLPPSALSAPQWQGLERQRGDVVICVCRLSSA